MKRASAAVVLFLLCACATDADLAFRRRAMERHVDCVADSCYRAGLDGRRPEEAGRAYLLDCAHEMNELESVMEKTIGSADARGGALGHWAEQMSGVCARRHGDGRADRCAAIRRGIDAKGGTRDEALELLEREYARACR